VLLLCNGQFIFEEAALKSYTGSQALQVAMWPILAAFRKRQERSSSGLQICNTISDEHENSHTRGLCNGPVAMMRKPVVP
jgi:hypothetical protein